MDSAKLKSSLQDFASNIEDLEESLQPLLKTALSASTSKLPLLDKAKLYVLATYAIESILFSYIRLHGNDAKTHPVFRELARVKQYFDKIKAVETAGLKPSAKLDKDAAGRFVKHALSGNDKYDKEREEQLKRERAGAKRKFEDMTERVGSQYRFEAMSKKMKADEEGGLVREQDDGSDIEVVEHNGTQKPEGQLSKEERKERRRQEKVERRAERKQSKLEATDTTAETPAGTETIIPKKQRSNKPPKGHHEAFEGLLKGPLPPVENKKDVRKRKSRKELRQKAEDERAAEMM